MIEGAVHGINVDPNWIVAIIAAGGAGLAAARWYWRSSAKRKRRQAEYLHLWQTVFGKPALVDESGVEYESAEPGIDQELAELRGAFYGHSTHPPHPGRRRSDNS